MIELKDVTAGFKDGGAGLKDCSMLFRDGELRRFNLSAGELIINVILGFCPVEKGYVCFDGMPLDRRSVGFLRKLIAYIPTPEGFEETEEPAHKQLKMIAAAIKSDANILLAVDPFSRLSGEQTAQTAAALKEKAASGAVVIVATDREDVF
ncbi:MAG: ABC transporter ATP-binding protein [Prevotella sp.]|nr:ABC transporter ATP-binding protein [Prevotella sp.]